MIPEPPEQRANGDLRGSLGSQSSGHRGVGHDFCRPCMGGDSSGPAFEAIQTGETNLLIWADFGLVGISVTRRIFIFSVLGGVLSSAQISSTTAYCFPRGTNCWLRRSLQKEEVLRRTRAEAAVKESQLIFQLVG